MSTRAQLVRPFVRPFVRGVLILFLLLAPAAGVYGYGRITQHLHQMRVQQAVWGAFAQRGGGTALAIVRVRDAYLIIFENNGQKHIGIWADGVWQESVLKEGTTTAEVQP